MSGSLLAIVNTRYPHLNDVFERVAAQVQAAGHRCRLFDNDAALRSATGEWPHVEVLLGMGTFKLDEGFLSQAGQLRGALSVITGIEGFDLPLASRHGVALSNGGVPENSLSVAEATVLMLLAVFYDLNGAQKLLRENQPRPSHLSTRMLYKRRIGFIGYGAIAREVARRLSTWDLEMVYTTRTARVEADDFARPVPLDELLQTSDAVVVLAPLNAQSRHLLDKDRLSSMKRGAVLVNMSRGGICDEEALVELLRDGHLAGAALDTFEIEPLPMSSPLRGLPNVVLTPHMIGHTADSHDAIERRVLSNTLRLLEGRLPEPLLNPDALESARFEWKP